MIKILDTLYHDRHYARFFVLETIARVPYFGKCLKFLLLHLIIDIFLNEPVSFWFYYKFHDDVANLQFFGCI